MRNILRHIYIPVLLAFLLVFTGCAGSSGPVKAITDAIVAYSDYYIQVRDLNTQVKEQASTSDSGKNPTDYTILAEIPDYPMIDASSINFTPPEPNLATGGVTVYQKQSALALRQALEQYAVNYPVASFVQIPITFSVENGKGGWSAHLTSQSKLTIQNAVEVLVSDVLEQNTAYQSNYRLLQISTVLSNLLAESFGGIEYARLIAIDHMTENGDGSYMASISFPAPDAVYDALRAAYVASFNQQFYGDALSARLSTEGISEIDLSNTPRQTADVTITYNSETGENALLDDGGLSTQIAVIKADAEAKATEAINAAWRVEPLDPPASGSILEGDSSGNTIHFKTSLKLGKYFYVRFYEISSDDVSEEGTLALGVFIEGGKSAKFSLPSGYYRVSCLVGNNWYGLDNLFGKDSKTYSGGNAVQSRDGYENNISFE